MPRTLAQRREALEKGISYEKSALDYLHSQGCQLVEKNFRCRVGEIDLVVREGQILVFVEVRVRARTALETTDQALGFRKRMKFRRAVEYYLWTRDQRDPGWRKSFLSLRIDYLATDGRTWDWYKDLSLESQDGK